MDSATADLLDLFARRGTVLAHLANGSMTKPDLVDALSVSRSTVDRAVRELENAELIKREPQGITLTTRGGLIFDLHEYFADVVTGIEAVTDSLDTVPVTQRPSYAQFANATIVTGGGAAPHRPLSVLEDELETVNRIRAVSMTVIPSVVEQIRNRVVTESLTVEMVVSEAVLARLVSTHGNALEDTLEQEAVHLYQTDSTLPYGVSVFDSEHGRTALLFLHGDGGISAVIQNDAPAAIAWADDLIDRERANAQPL